MISPRRTLVAAVFNCSKIGSYEYVEPILGKVEEWAVFAGTPAGLGYALYCMARKGLLQAGGNTLV